MVTTIASDTTLHSYEVIAPFYDAITEVPRYERWPAMVSSLIKHHVPDARTLVDLGCGTGKSAIEFHRAGYEVTGMDLSPAMIDVARVKRGRPGLTFQLGDLRALPLAGPFDAATSMGEPMNYLADDAELATALSGVRSLLRVGGVAVFELNTARAFSHVASAVSFREADDAVVVVRGETPDFTAGGRCTVVFDCFVPTSSHAPPLDHGAKEVIASRDPSGRLWTRSTTRHEQRHFTDAQVRAALDESGLRLLATHGIRRGELRPDLDESQDLKAFYVACNDGDTAITPMKGGTS